MDILKKLKNIKENIGILYRVFGGYRYRVLFLAILGFMGSLSEGLGIGVLVPVFSFVTGKAVLGTDFISQNIGALFIFLGIQPKLLPLLILICALFIFKAVMKLAFGYVSTVMLANFELEMRGQIYRRSLAAKWGYLLKQKVGDMQHLLLNHLNYTFVSLRSVANNITDVTGFMVYIGIAFMLSPYITGATIVGGIVFLSFNLPLSIKIKRLAERRTNAAFTIADFVTENSLGLKTIKAMNLEQKVSSEADSYFIRFTKARKALSFTKAMTSVMLEPFSILFISGVFGVAYKFSQLDLGVFVATIYLIHKTFIYFGKVQEAINEFNDSIPYVKSINNIQNELSESKELFYGDKKFEFNKRLVFENLSFAYISEKHVLSDVNFSIKKGEMIGVIGPSGAGKTTIVDLLLRLFEASEGKIILDDTNIKDIDIKEWRRNVGYVSQDMFLKNDTVANNIKFFDETITEQAMIDAAKMVGAYEFIQKLPQGFDTQIGERGVLLSGGQRQRIVLARVMTRNPKILILDEATSALDNESEAMIKKTIEELKGGITIIAIAHRLSTVMSSDKLMVLQDGKIVEVGSPTELLADKDSYFYKVSNIS